MKNAVFSIDASQLPVDKQEILRYAGVRGESNETDSLLESCLALAAPVLTPQLIYTEIPVSQVGEDGLDLCFATVHSKALAKRLSGCRRAIVFAATVGIRFDRLLARYSLLSPTKALLLDAIGNERVEAFCNAFEASLYQELIQKGSRLRPRFSPGYADLPIFFQKEIFSVLECEKTIGLFLGEQMLMSPSKSVTAIIGIVDSNRCV